MFGDACASTGRCGRESAARKIATHKMVHALNFFISFPLIALNCDRHMMGRLEISFRGVNSERFRRSLIDDWKNSITTLVTYKDRGSDPQSSTKCSNWLDTISR